MGAMQALCLLAAFVLSVGRVSTDYVVTGPSLAPPIPPGQCPYVFKDVNIKYAQGFCPTDFQAKNPVFSTSCCNALEGLIFQSRVQLANETGVLLLPQSSADACIKAAAQAFAPGAEQLFATCGINSTLLSIESGAPCGTELLTVYDFWEASGHSFPGIVGASCFQASDCTACTTQVNRKIASLRGNATLLSSPACQALGQIAMTAAAYPVVVANGISGCVRKVPILKLDQSPVCESLDWDEIEFSSAALSCGPAQIRSDRCCDLILGIGGQAHSIYANRTGHSIPQDQVQACVAALNSRLVKAGVTTSVAERCQLGPFPLLFAVGCYNYSNYDARIPDHLLVDGAGDACNPNQGNCSNSICQTQFDSASAFLANSSDPQVTNLCGFLVMSQYLARYDSLSEITARLNCFVNYPAPLALGFVTPKSRALTMSAIAGIVSACTVVLLILVAITAVVCKRRSLKEGLDECLGRGSRQWTGMPGLMLESFSFSTLKRATKNFSEDRLLGRGGSGKVFMGELRGNLVAVKVISREPVAGGSKEFQNEVLSMARLRHRHLVSLEGCCNSPRHYILVYEFMANGSLDDHLYPPKGGPAHVVPEGSQTRFLDWPTRMKIALGTAKGLTYLHEDCNPRILHRDIKPSNILLDSDFEAKVADFGLAKLTTDGDTHLTASIAGTWGFMAPEYAASGRLTDKSDVYSFGVVLLTLVAGRRPIEPLDVQDKVYLIEWAWTLAEADALQELLDVRLTSALKEHAAAIDNVTRIALLCIHSSVNLRPTMVECIRMLTGTAPVPALRPGLIFTPTSLATPGPSSDWNSTDGSAGWSGLSRGVLSNQSVVSGHSMLSNQSSLSKIELAARTESIEADDLEPGTGT